MLLKNVNVLNGKEDMEVQENQDIYIVDGIIKEIGPNLSYEDKETIDMKGAYATPGLINLHVHLPGSGKVGKKKVADLKSLIKFICSNAITRKIGVGLGAKYAKVELYSGVTTLRAVGGVSNFDAILRDKIEKGKAVGPRILASNTAIGVPGGHMDGTVATGAETIEDAIRLVQEQKDQGADLIKLMVTGGVLDCKERGKPGVLRMSEEMAKACVYKAHELGMKVAAHIEGPEGVEVGIRAGIDTIEHGADVDTSYIEMLKNQGGAYVATFSPAIPLAYLDPSVSGYPEAAQYNTIVLLKGMQKMTSECLKLGVLVGLGTDTGCPFVTHYDMWRELFYFAHFVEGVDNKFALHTATEINARIAGVDRITGTIEVGKSADILLVSGNPLEDIKVLKEPVCVISRGKLYKEKNEKYPNVEEALEEIMKQI